MYTPSQEDGPVRPEEQTLERKRRQTKRAAIVVGLVLAWCPRVFALDPSLDISQYAHTRWKVSEGFCKGVIRALAQTLDGYLWVGTDFGLFRFDGVRAVPWQPPAGEHLPAGPVTRLLGGRDGTLWIGALRGLASWRAGKLTHYPELEGQRIEALLEDREGTIWAGGWAPSAGTLCSIRSGSARCDGRDGRFGSGVTALYEDREGNLWAGETGSLWRWKPGPPEHYALSDPSQVMYALTGSDDGGILVARRNGITKLKDGKIEAYARAAGPEFKPARLLRDHHGGVWIGAVVDEGVLHIHNGRTDSFTPADGLSGGAVSSLLEDFEGNIWVATVDGIERFRDFAIPTISVEQGLSSRGVDSVLVASDGSVWLGTSDGLNRWNQGQVTIYRRRSMRGGRVGAPFGGPGVGWSAQTGVTVREITDSGLPEDAVNLLFEDELGQLWVGTLNGVAIFRAGRFFRVESVPPGFLYSITGDHAGNVWISHQEGLFRLAQSRVVQRLPWAKLGRREPATALVHDPVKGGLWLGFRDGGAAYLENDQLRASYSGSEGMGGGMVGSFYMDGNQTLWVATEGGLSRIKDGRVLTLTIQNGLPCNMVHWMLEDDARSVWLHLACGVVRIPRSELDAWVSDPKRRIGPTLFDSSDGVRSLGSYAGSDPVAAKTADGRLWFRPFGGVSVIDPRRLAFNALPPPVHIEQVVADGKAYIPSNGLRLPQRVRDVAIDFTALSLVAPEKVHFKYMLEGQDPDWKEFINERHAQYTNLSPRNYRFRVIASNNSGVWNEEGATLDFLIPPAWYQTSWFLASCAIAFLAFLYGLYRLRLHQLAREFNMGLEARVNERTRIARDLHDTLLQSFHGLLLRFQTAYDLLPPNANEAREQLETGIDKATQALVEGREAVQALRTSTVQANDLAVAIASIGKELASSRENGNSPGFQVEVKGQSRNLHPILRDESYKIALEAMRNAFQHAGARKIEVEIRYEDKQFSIHIRDDGKGIDPQVLSEGRRDGHFGLHGMQERATIAGGKLAIWSQPAGGTEIELTIPASAAYASSRPKVRQS
jgi:signal transduction histidine kinase/ligand-binding sensor domain-containing protein